MLPIKEWLYIGAIIAILSAFSWYTYHERSVQHQKDIAADARVVAAQQIHDKEVIDKASTLAKDKIDELQNQINSKPASDAPSLRVCIPKSPSPPRVPTVPSGQKSDAVPGESTVVPEQDLGHELDKRFADDDARLKAAQIVLQACIDSGRCVLE